MGISSLDKNRLNACNLFLSAVTQLDLLLQKHVKGNDMKIKVTHKETKMINDLDVYVWISEVLPLMNNIYGMRSVYS